MKRKELIGKILIERLMINESIVINALTRQKTDKMRICSQILKAGALSEEVLARALSYQYGIPAIVLGKSQILLSNLGIVPYHIARQNQILPVATSGEKVILAMRDPENTQIISEIEFISGKKVMPHIALEFMLSISIDEAYRLYKLSREGLLRGKDIPSNAIKEEHIEVAIAELSVEPELAGPDRFEVVSMQDDIENITRGRDIADEFRDRNKPLICIVDDEPEIRTLLKKIVISEGYDTVEFSRGDEAFRSIPKVLPDLIILDAMLPGMHGFDICKALKTDSKLRNIPIIIVSAVYTGWRFMEDIKKTHGADDYIEKPFRIDMLTNKIKALLRKVAPHSGTTTGELSIDVKNLYNSAVRLYKEGDIDGAIYQFKKGIEKDNFYYRLHYGLALCYQSKKEDYMAISELEKTVELKPDFLPALKALALLYQQKGFRNKAVEAWERALNVASDEETRTKIKEYLIKIL
ncbi:MAG: response regulator [Deltaproteobacteria bacterium]|nr:response regulator [Deltaproteobacteria bacterium]